MALLSMGQSWRVRRSPRLPMLSTWSVPLVLGALLLCWRTSGQGLIPDESTVAGSSRMFRALEATRRSAAKLNTPGRVKCAPGSGYMCASALTDDEDKESTWMMAAAPRVYSALNPGQTGGIRPYLAPADQGKCQTCVSLAVSAAATASVAHALGLDAAKLRDLSPQDLHYCSDPGSSHGCHMPRSMSQLVQSLEPLRRDSKLRTSTCLPYTSRMRLGANKQSICTPPQPQKCQQRPTALGGRFDTQREGSEPALVQLYVRMYGGVVTRIRVYPDLYDFFKRQPKGVYPGPSPAALKGKAVEHAVVIVGYDNQAGFWLLRNSWGPGWGDGGYFRVSYAASPNLGLLSTADTFVITWQPSGKQTKGRRLQGTQQLQPVAGKPGCFSLKAGPRDWLADVAHRYGMYSVLDLVNNNTQLLAPGRLDEAPVGKTLLLCDVDPKVAATAANAGQPKARAWKLAGAPSEVYGRETKQVVVNQRGRLPGAGLLRRVCVRTDGTTVSAIQTQHGSGNLVTMGSSAGRQKVYTQCLDLAVGEDITSIEVNADDAGVAGLKLQTSRRSMSLGNMAPCERGYSSFTATGAWRTAMRTSRRSSCSSAPGWLCRRRLQAAPTMFASFTSPSCKFVQPPAEKAFVAGFTVHAEAQRLVGLQVHWGVQA